MNTIYLQAKRQVAHLLGMFTNMYGKILKRDITFKEKIKKIITYFRRCRGVRKAWRKRHKSVFNQNSGYTTPCREKVEQAHKKLWSSFNTRADMSTLRIAANISGKADPRIVPEEIFVAHIEPSLMIEPAIKLLNNKSVYNRWLPGGRFPADLLHCIDGQWYDDDLKRLNQKEFVEKIKSLNYPVVIKPNRSSNGGDGVGIAKNVNELQSISLHMPNSIIQPKIEQHPFFNAFHPYSINTIRVYLYRSVKDHKQHILSMDLTVGRSGSKVNNETAGGIYSGIDQDGELVGYAVDKFGTRYKNHPDTGEQFNQTIPDIEGLKKLSLEVGEQIPLATILGLDVFYDKTGQWRMMEINTHGHSIRSAQYFGTPFFGKFTDEVITYCQQNHWALR